MPAKFIRSLAPNADEGMKRGKGTVVADFLRKLRRLDFLICFCIMRECWSIASLIVNIQS